MTGVAHDRGSKFFEHCILRRFGEEVGKYCACWAILNLDVTTVYLVLYKEESYIYLS